MYSDAVMLRDLVRKGVEKARSSAQDSDADKQRRKKDSDKRRTSEGAAGSTSAEPSTPAAKSKKSKSGACGGDLSLDLNEEDPLLTATASPQQIKKLKIKTSASDSVVVVPTTTGSSATSTPSHKKGAGGSASAATTPSLKIKIGKDPSGSPAPATSTGSALKVELVVPKMSPVLEEELGRITIKAPPKRPNAHLHSQLQDICQKVLDDVRYALDRNGRQYAELFVQLPSKEDLPEYYKVITNPIDMSNIQRKIREGKYRRVQDFHDHLARVFQNALTFNEPGSEIYSNAVLLRAFMVQCFKKYCTEISTVEMEGEPIEFVPTSSAKKASASKSAVSTPKEKTKAEREELESEEGGDDKKAHGPPTAFWLDEEGTKTEFYIGRDVGRFLSLGKGDLYRNYPLLYRRRCTDEERTSLIEAGIITDNQATVFVVKKLQTDMILEGKGQLFKDISRYRKQKAAEQKLDIPGFTADLSGATSLVSIPTGGSGPGTVVYINNSPLETASPIGSQAETDAALKICSELLSFVETYVDEEGVSISDPFHVLPTREELPEYYQMISNPQDFESIRGRLKSRKYATAADFVRDMGLVFTNATIFNDEASLLVAHAKALQAKFCERACALLPRQTVFSCPFLRQGSSLLTTVVRDLLNRIDKAVDPQTGRLIASAFNVLPDENELPDYYNAVKNPVALSMIRERNFDGSYFTLSEVQEDVFTMCRNARSFNEHGSTFFEDAVALQRFFMNELRAAAEAHGIVTSATNYTEEKLVEELDMEKRVSLASDAMGGEEGKRDYTNEVASEEDGVRYRVGDFVLLANPAPGKPPHVVNVSKLWKGPDGRQYLQAVYYYRPEETFHLATKTFFVNEVLRSNDVFVHPLAQVIRRCYVAFVRDYQRSTPAGIPEEDYFVCESRYTTKGRAMSRIKQWQSHDTVIELIPRDKTLDPRTLPRKKSIFAESASAAASNVSGDPRNVVLSKPPGGANDEMLSNAAASAATASNGGSGGSVATGAAAASSGGSSGGSNSASPKYVYFEAMFVDGMRYRLGDAVYLKTKTASDNPLIARIERLWKDEKDATFFHGSVYLRPEETYHEPECEFMEQEVLKSSITETHSFDNVLGRCQILHVDEYAQHAPLDLAPEDVYVCDSRYAMKQRQASKIKTLGEIKLSQADTQDLQVFREPREIKRAPRPNAEGAEEEVRKRREETLFRFDEMEKQIRSKMKPVDSKDFIKRQHNPSPFTLFSIGKPQRRMY